MPLYFVQHGIALPKDVDPDRPLSEEGKTDVERIASHLNKIGIRINKVFHSGKTRAEQTASIFSEQIGDGSVRPLDGMNPNDSVKAFANHLESDNAMYVGHLPHMGKLVSQLVTGDEETGVVQFTNAGVVCLEKDETGFHVHWYLTPATCSAE